MKSYRDLIVWSRAVNLCESIYRVTALFPRQETYGLVTQMRRASVSVPSNIAEALGRYTRKDCLHFLRNSRGSLLVLETQLIISQRLNFLNALVCNELLEETAKIGRLLNGLSTYMERQIDSVSVKRGT